MVEGEVWVRVVDLLLLERGNRLFGVGGQRQSGVWFVQSNWKTCFDGVVVG